MNLRERIDKWLASRQSTMQRKRELTYEIRSESKLQVVEYDGKIYLSCDGNPVVSVEHLTAPVPYILKESRKDWVRWQMKTERPSY